MGSYYARKNLEKLRKTGVKQERKRERGKERKERKRKKQRKNVIKKVN